MLLVADLSLTTHIQIAVIYPILILIVRMALSRYAPKRNWIGWRLLVLYILLSFVTFDDDYGVAAFGIPSFFTGLLVVSIAGLFIFMPLDKLWE